MNSAAYRKEALTLAQRYAESTATAFPLERICDFPQQLAFAQDPATFVTAVCSRRAGKSHGSAARLFSTALGKPQAPILYFTTTRKEAKRIMWQPMLRMNQEHGLGFEAIESDLIFKRGGLARIYLTGCDNESEIGKMRGSGWGDVVGDEAQLFPQYIKPLVQDVLTPSLMDYDGAIRLIGTPGPVPVGYFYEAAHNKQWSPHYWTCWENPHVEPRKTLEKALALRGITEADPSIQREFWGRWVYDPNALVFRFDAARNVYSELPGGEWETVIGVDLGFDDADAIAVLAFAAGRSEAHLREEHVLAKQTITQLAEKLTGLIKKYEPHSVVMDTGGLGKKIAEEIQARHKLPIRAAEKSRKFEYIELLNDAMRSGRFFVPRGSRFAQDAMLVEWDREKSTNDKLVISDRFHSDICDAVLYAFRESLHWLHEPRPPVGPAVGSAAWAKEEEDRMEEYAIEQAERQAREEEDEAEWS